MNDKAKPPAADIPELAVMVRRLRLKHGATALSMAATQALTAHLLTEYGATHKHDLEGMVELHQESTKAWCQSRGVPYEDILHALDGLKRAGETANYLARMPA